MKITERSEPIGAGYSTNGDSATRVHGCASSGLPCVRFPGVDRLHAAPRVAEPRATCWQPISSSVMIGASVPSLSERRPMTEVTRTLSAIEQGEPHAAEQLLPLVYDELRKLAAHKLAGEAPGQTLEATALVHEAYLRLVGEHAGQRSFQDRGHFFAAAATAMRRIASAAAAKKWPRLFQCCAFSTSTRRR